MSRTAPVTRTRPDEDPAQVPRSRGTAGSAAVPPPEDEAGLLEPIEYDPELDDTLGKDPEEVLAEPTPPKAGRNLKAAIGVGLLLGGGVIAALLLRKEVVLAVIVLAVGVGVWELRQAIKRIDSRPPVVPVLAGMVAMIVFAYREGPGALTLAWSLTAVAIIVWRAGSSLVGAARDVVGGLFLTAYPAFFAGFAAILLAQPDGPGRVFVFILTTVFSDIGGYAAGVRFGRHPMAPTISPKKSWEGFAGSVLACVVTGSLSVWLALHHPWWVGAVLGAVVAVAATTGDLFESLIKRDLGIKDMSHILPGHGGVMDRLDSLVVAAPVVWGVLHLLAPSAVVR